MSSSNSDNNRNQKNNEDEEEKVDFNSPDSKLHANLISSNHFDSPKLNFVQKIEHKPVASVGSKNHETE